MTANERDYWWRLTHRVIQTKKRESKWKKEEDGESVTRECPVCKAEEEEWDHYDYECRGVKEMNKKVAESMGEHMRSAEASGAWRKKGWRRR